MKFPIKLLILAVIDFILIWLWTSGVKPANGVAIYIIFVVPLAFIINMVIALILLIIKKKEAALLFSINSVIAAIIMGVLFWNAIQP